MTVTSNMEKMTLTISNGKEIQIGRDGHPVTLYNNSQTVTFKNWDEFFMAAAIGKNTIKTAQRQEGNGWPNAPINPISIYMQEFGFTINNILGKLPQGQTKNALDMIAITPMDQELPDKDGRLQQRYIVVEKTTHAVVCGNNGIGYASIPEAIMAFMQESRNTDPEWIVKRAVIRQYLENNPELIIQMMQEKPMKHMQDYLSRTGCQFTEKEILRVISEIAYGDKSNVQT